MSLLLLYVWAFYVPYGDNMAWAVLEENEEDEVLWIWEANQDMEKR